MISRRIFVAGAAATLAAAPAAWAQPATPRIALVDRIAVTTADMVIDGLPTWSVLLSALHELGRIEGETIIVERWNAPNTSNEEFVEVVRRIVDSRPTLIVVRGGFAIASFRAATTTIPIVGIGTFPADLIDRLARPGGNLTGVDANAGGTLSAKRLQILHDAVPSASRIAVLTNPVLWEDERRGGAIRAAAAQLGLNIEPVLLTRPISEEAIRRAVSSISDRGFDAIYIGSVPGADRTFIVEQIVGTGLPMIAGSQWASAGVLIAYFTELLHMYRRLASFVDRILKGADPGELPIELPTEFELVVNLKTARELGITFPTSILLGATEVIE